MTKGKLVREILELMTAARQLSCSDNQKKSDQEAKQKKRLLRVGGGAHLVGKMFQEYLMPNHPDPALNRCIFCHHSNMNYNRDPAVVARENDGKIENHGEAMIGWDRQRAGIHKGKCICSLTPYTHVIHHIFVFLTMFTMFTVFILQQRSLGIFLPSYSSTVFVHKITATT
jgi:hypothetical protein